VVPAALDIGFGVLSRAPVRHGARPRHDHRHAPALPRQRDRGGALDHAAGWEEFNLTGFSFDVPGELVLGTWTFEAHADAQELFHVTFEVVPPDMAAPVLAECQMGFTS
jgi:hypothetical protein